LELRGEDDLDAPDLKAPTTSSSEPQRQKEIGQPNGGIEHPKRPLPDARSAQATSVHFKPILDPEASAALRDRLVVELKVLNSAEDAANWANRVLRDKDSLSLADATCIEEAFRAKLATLPPDTTDESETPPETKLPKAPSYLNRGKKQQLSSAIDKSVLPLTEPRRVRDRNHVRYVTQQSCLICGRRPSDAHHLRFAQSRALGRKASDEFTVPLCRGHHREVHRSGDEVTWWEKAGVDPTLNARALWLRTHPLVINSNISASDANCSMRQKANEIAKS
jgi:hypothetical protein